MAKKKRPGVVVALRIIHIILGGLNNPNRAKNDLDILAEVYQRYPSYQVMEAGANLLALVLGIVLIVAGIGLLNMKNWGRWASAVYAVLNIFLQIGYVIFRVF